MTLDAAVAPTADAATDEVLGIVREVLARNDVREDDDLFDRGATSLAFVRVLAEVNRRFGVVVPVADLSAATAREIATYVTQGA